MTKIITRFILLPISFLFIYCKSTKTDLTYNSETLKLIPLSENSFIHSSYLRLENGALVECNGLVYMNDSSAIIFDSPSDRKTTSELINWLTISNHLNLIGLVVNHYHTDCLGGIEEFHARGISSYANRRTLSKISDSRKKPQKEFEEELTLKVGNAVVVNRFFGEAHSPDNIVSYIPEENLLFGGCMIKSLNATKGNLNDANLEEWTNTVGAIKSAYPNLKIIVPGHGPPGDISLLNYTMRLFSSNK